MLRSFCRVGVCAVFSVLLCVENCSSQQFTDHTLSTVAAATSSSTSATTAVITPKFQPPVFAGLYAPDGTFRKPRRISGNGSAYPGFNSPYASDRRPAPEFMDLHSIEDVVENFEPPGHASQRLRTHSFLGNLRDDLVTFAYGREWVLKSPTMVTTDSRHRLIIADPQQHSVHVLEPKGHNSFRIAGGPDLRLRAPSSVAVDAEDNIYVADSKKGVVLVFDPQGYYVRSVGTYAGESMFQDPQSIAIDRKLKRIYVLDAPMRELFILDLSGRLIRRIGGRRDRNIQLVNPLQIAVGDNRVFVLENSGLRIQVFSPNGDVLGSFPVPREENSPAAHATAIALDPAGNIYVSNPVGFRVEILTSDGKLLGFLGQPGINAGDFSSPAGLWVDSTGSLYVADTLNRRVQMFKLTSQNPGS